MITEEKKEVLFLNLVNPEQKREGHKRKIKELRKYTGDIVQQNCAPYDTYKRRESAEVILGICVISFVLIIICEIAYWSVHLFKWIF